MNERSHLDLLERATLYVLDAFGAEERAAVNAEMLRSEALRRAVRDVAEVGGHLMHLSRGPRPPATLRERVFAKLERAPFHFSRAASRVWQPGPNGASELPLHDAPGSCRLLRLERDAIHRMAVGRPEQWMVVTGEMSVGGFALQRGDYFEAPTSQTAHATTDSSVVLVCPPITPAGSAARAVRAGEDTWVRVAPGIFSKALSADVDNRTQFLLLKMAPGSTVEDHDHGGAEELFLLDGACTFAGLELVAGDYHRAAPNTHHGSTTTKHGCLMVYINRVA